MGGFQDCPRKPFRVNSLRVFMSNQLLPNYFRCQWDVLGDSEWSVVLKGVHISATILIIFSLDLLLVLFTLHFVSFAWLNTYGFIRVFIVFTFCTACLTDPGRVRPGARKSPPG